MALRSSRPVLGNPANRNRAVPLTYEQFRFGFANAVSEDGLVAMGQSNDTTFLRPIGEGHITAAARARRPVRLTGTSHHSPKIPARTTATS